MINKNYVYVKCNLCGSNEYTIFYEKIPAINNLKECNTYSASSSEICYDQIVKCNKCGLIYINPRPIDDIILQGYINAIDETYISQKEARIKTFKKAINFIEKCYPQKGIILDIGAAAGFFLKVAKENGWQTYGVEPCKWLCEYSNKNYDVNVLPTTLEKTNFNENFFDVVVLWDTLEHMLNPFGTLKIINRILKKDGLLVINFPDIGDFLSKFFKRKWWFLLSIHLYYFNVKTLSMMLEKSGFETIHINFHFQTLELGYLLYRLKSYSHFLSKHIGLITKFLKLSKLKIPYYASQKNVISRKLTSI